MRVLPKGDEPIIIVIIYLLLLLLLLLSDYYLYYFVSGILSVTAHSWVPLSSPVTLLAC